MTESAAVWSQPDTLEDVFMSAGDGKADAVAELAKTLEGVSSGGIAVESDAVREGWETGSELVFEAIDRHKLRPEDITFVLQLARAGLDTPPLRDAFASMVRSEYSSYLDPAGLLRAVGVHEGKVSTPDMFVRWRLVQQIKSGVHCYHPAHGVGVIKEMDDIANEVVVQFDRRQRLSLSLALADLSMVSPGSVLDGLLSGKTKWASVKEQDDLKAALIASVVTARSVNAQLLASFLVPGVVSAEDLAAAMKVRGPAKTAAKKAEVPAAPQRTWDQARGIAELVDLLRRVKKIESEPEGLENIVSILGSVAGRREHAENVAETAARFWHYGSDQPWVTDVLKGIADQALCWTDTDLFVALTDKLPGRLLLAWNGATLAARGTEYLVEVTMELPLRLWSYVEKVLDLDGEAQPLLLEAVLERMKSGDVSSDALLWLWKSGTPERAALATPVLLFKTLAKPVRGSFIKARKDLYKLLMGNQDFQRLIMKDGEEAAVRELIRCTRHLPLLDSGEKQSLLVKIVRIFPEARALVEQKHKVVARRPVGRITAARSFELRRRELEDIVNVKIPANARAIASAREHGDLRENAEYKAAKDEQALLGARREELEDGLHDIRPTDFSDVVVRDTAIPGSTITIKYEDGKEDLFHLLGLWDSVPERHMISFETPVGAELLGSKLGDIVTMPSGMEAEIVSIASLPDDVVSWVRGDDL